MFDKEFATGKHIRDGLVEHETERTGIDTAPRAVANIDELHVAVVEHTVFQSLRHIVHLRRDHRILHLQLVGIVLPYLEQRDALGVAFRYTIVLTTYLYHRG